MELLLCSLIGYAFGCIQSSYIFVKCFEKADIRSKGSGNAGTMNTFLSFGKTLGAIVLFCDMLKTIISCLLCTVIIKSVDPVTIISFCSIGVFLGHCFPFWLGFRGGKGVAVAISFALILDIRIFLISIIVAGAFGIILHSATYSSYTFAVMLFVSTVCFGYPGAVIVCVLAESLLISYLHIKPHLFQKSELHSKR